MDFVLWPACVKSHTFADQLKAASASGFDCLPIGPLTCKTLRSEGVSPAEIRQMASDNGIRLGHYDGFTDWAPLRYGAELPEAARAVFDVSADECLDICGELGLTRICATGAFSAGEVETAALIDGFATFCQQAARQDIHVDLEFIPMWGIPSLELAWQIVEAAGCDNGGILFDSWHFCRGTADMALLRKIPAGVIATVQLADAAAKLQGSDLFEDCIRYRRLPGDGDLPLREILDIFRSKGGITNIGPEIFSDELDLMAADKAGLAVAAATSRVLSEAGIPLSL